MYGTVIPLRVPLEPGTGSLNTDSCGSESNNSDGSSAFHVKVRVKNMARFQFNKLLLEVSNELSPGQLEQLKFLLRDKDKEGIGKKVLEKIDNGLKLFELMKERNELAADNTNLLSELLKGINRQDLAGKIDCFIIQPDPSYGVDEAEEEKLKIATQVIAENLGKNWRKLGRKLGLTEARLDSISKRHPDDLQETAMELLKEWRKDKRADAQVTKLIDALRACQLNLTADKVESSFASFQPNLDC